ncbi:MAG: hypothetical protein AAFR76_01420 [Planctomycetota bacterium]
MKLCPDPYRWISIDEAIRRIPLRDSSARALLKERGLVHVIGGREVVWLDDLRHLTDVATARRQTQQQLNQASRADGLVEMPE